VFACADPLARCPSALAGEGKSARGTRYKDFDARVFRDVSRSSYRFCVGGLGVAAAAAGAFDGVAPAATPSFLQSTSHTS
jgi:hypothetical protein